jgi:hypothetical protein
VVSLKFLDYGNTWIPFKNLSNFLSEVRHLLAYKGYGDEYYPIYYEKFYTMALRTLDVILEKIAEISK